MGIQLLAQLKSWNPWWDRGPAGMDAYQGDPTYQREPYSAIKSQFLNSDQIVSIVGMRQVGKSTIMRQIIRDLLNDQVETDAEHGDNKRF